MNDVKFAVRQLARSPGFTLIAVLTLALGIGANTAIFSFVNAILLRPLPYREPDRLVMVFENHVETGSHKDAAGPPMLGEWRRQSTVFEGLAGRGGETYNLTGEGQPENVRGATISANMFSVLGLKPALGRDFLPEEETYGRHHVALLSHELWRRRFGGNTNIVGSTVQMNAETWTVVGVMPPRVFFPDQNSEIWTPLAFSPERLRERHNHSVLVYGRLKAGVSMEQARREMDETARRMASANDENKGWGAEVFPLQDILVGDIRPVLMALLGAVGLVLLIACANVANLLLARSTARAREFSIRAALGAGRAQIVRQLLTESLLLSALGSAAGLLLARAGLGVLVRFSPADVPRIWEGVAMDVTTLGFTAGLALATGVLFGLAPAWQLSRRARMSGLNESGRGGSRGGEHRVRSALVVAEVALSVTLLAGAGLMIRSFSRLVSQPLGYVPEHLVTVNIDLPGKKYPTTAENSRFFEQLLQRTRELPGVESAACAYGMPLGLWQGDTAAEVKGAPPPAKGEPASAGYAQISPGYFRTMKILLLKGSDFSEQDREKTAAKVIVDEAFARRFNLGPEPLGRRVSLGEGTKDAEIIGVVKATKQSNLAEAAYGKVYRSYQQNCWGSMTLIARTRREPSDIAKAIRGAVAGIDKDVPLLTVQTMTELVATSTAQRRLSVRLLGGFSAAAVFLAAIGLYGVLAQTVTQRTREFGIRMALGARRADVVGLVLRQGAVLTGAGLAAGLTGALMLTRLISGMLYEVKPFDPATFTAVAGLLGLAALCASWLPAHRATRVDPMEALRAE